MAAFCQQHYAGNNFAIWRKIHWYMLKTRKTLKPLACVKNSFAHLPSCKLCTIWNLDVDMIV
ncbi:hypothetical protein BDR06DRAFT_961248 [Suillus hirtellus]|nr:hypothetical protein BDR06DRAFT_961248 [Suillus hirtellus]